MNILANNPITKGINWWKENRRMVFHLALFFLGLMIIGFIVFRKVEGNDRIVYGSSSTNIRRHKADCAKRGGSFNECGVGCENSPCKKSTVVCYYTCELK